MGSGESALPNTAAGYVGRHTPSASSNLHDDAEAEGESAEAPPSALQKISRQVARKLHFTRAGCSGGRRAGGRSHSQVFLHLQQRVLNRLYFLRVQRSRVILRPRQRERG